MIYSKNETEAAITYLKFIVENFKYFSASEKQTHLNALEYHHSIFFSNLIVIDENYNSEIAYNKLFVSFLVQLNFISAKKENAELSKIPDSVYIVYSKAKFNKGNFLIDYLKSFYEIDKVFTVRDFYPINELEKDLQLIIDKGYIFDIVDAIRLVSSLLDSKIIKKMLKHYNDDLKGKVFDKRYDVMQGEIEMRRSLRKVLERKTQKGFNEFEIKMYELITEFGFRRYATNKEITNILVSGYLNKTPVIQKYECRKFFSSVVRKNGNDIVNHSTRELLLAFKNIFLKIYDDDIYQLASESTFNTYISYSIQIANKKEYGLYRGNYDNYLNLQIKTITGL